MSIPLDIKAYNNVYSNKEPMTQTEKEYLQIKNLMLQGGPPKVTFDYTKARPLTEEEVKQLYDETKRAELEHGNECW